jgi:hypothetical protein
MTRALLALAVLAACSRQPRDPAPVTPSAADRKVEAQAIDAGAPIVWQWDDAAPRWYKDPVVIRAWGDRIVFTKLDDNHANVRRVAPRYPVERTVWTHELAQEFVPDAALLADSDRVYVAYHSSIDSGGHLIALSRTDGHELWNVALEALGPVAHSEYENSIQLAMKEGRVVVFGLESSGRYIEAFSYDGKRVSHQRVP